MDINVLWHKPIDLLDGSEQNLIYTVKEDDISRFEGLPGVYMFCRIYSDVLSPLYIGKALDLGSRIRQQFNTTKLMKAVENSPKGTKVLVVGEFKCKSGQNNDVCIKLVEKILIEHALAEGNDLVNLQGTKVPYHEIAFTGNSLVKGFTGAQMLVKQVRK
jgi:hypothetical protein